MPNPVRIAPSILSADFAQLGDAIHSVENGGADMIHIDVMDGRFVPNITMGPLVVKAARRVTDLPLDVHLMIVEPERYIDAFADAGASIITVHVEASQHLHRTLQAIRSLGVKAGVAINPHTPITILDHVWDLLDLVLVMTVNPGFAAQSFIETMLPKIAQTRERIDSHRPGTMLEVDGGISPKTARQVVTAGADTLVAGNAVFGAAEGPAAAVQTLRVAATGSSA